MPNPNKMVRSTGGAARNAIGKAYAKPRMAGTSAAGMGRGRADSMPKAKAKGPGKDAAYKPGDMFRSGRMVQPGAASGKPKAKPSSAAANFVQNLSDDYGFKTDVTHFAVYGLCAACVK